MKKPTWDEIRTQINNVNKLEELFDLWRLAHTLEENHQKTTVEGMEKDSFVADGYISEKDYDRVLFILKESNLLDYRGKGMPSMRSQEAFYESYLHNGEDNRPKQKEKIGRMACYLLTQNEKPNEDEIKNALKNSSFMNLNKRGGANYDIKVSAYTEKYVDFIKMQIEILNPNVIVCLGTFDLIQSNQLNVINGETVPTINMWHTAYRMSNVEKPEGKWIADRNVNAYMREFIGRYTRAGIISKFFRKVENELELLYRRHGKQPLRRMRNSSDVENYDYICSTHLNEFKTPGINYIVRHYDDKDIIFRIEIAHNLFCGFGLAQNGKRIKNKKIVNDLKLHDLFDNTIKNTADPWWICWDYIDFEDEHINFKTFNENFDKLLVPKKFDEIVANTVKQAQNMLEKLK